MEKEIREKKRECLSCVKFFECPQKKAVMEGCIHYEVDQKIKEKYHER